mmetsp:Transcript_23494/g.44272  ORF Transcript_23494/g.44272 Transcript_23494/m.44272 type:complete len:141 (+) Transcript_23494:71-493(+)
MEFFARSVQPPPRHVTVDVDPGGTVKVDRAAMDHLATTASRILSKKLHEVPKPPPAPRPRDKLPFSKSSNEDLERNSDSDCESLCSASSESSFTDDGLGFPTVLSDSFREEPDKSPAQAFAPVLPNEQSDMLRALLHFVC